jgi:hypothetical protein
MDDNDQPQDRFEAMRKAVQEAVRLRDDAKRLAPAARKVSKLKAKPKPTAKQPGVSRGK